MVIVAKLQLLFFSMIMCRKFCRVIHTSPVICWLQYIQFASSFSLQSCITQCEQLWIILYLSYTSCQEIHMEGLTQVVSLNRFAISALPFCVFLTLVLSWQGQNLVWCLGLAQICHSELVVQQTDQSFVRAYQEKLFQKHLKGKTNGILTGRAVLLCWEYVSVMINELSTLKNSSTY